MSAQKHKLKIVSDGTAKGTKVLAGDIEVEVVCEIDIHTMCPGRNISASIRVLRVELALDGVETEVKGVEK